MVSAATDRRQVRRVITTTKTSLSDRRPYLFYRRSRHRYRPPRPADIKQGNCISPPPSSAVVSCAVSSSFYHHRTQKKKKSVTFLLRQYPPPPQVLRLYAYVAPKPFVQNYRFRGSFFPAVPSSTCAYVRNFEVKKNNNPPCRHRHRRSAVVRYH